MADIAPWDAKAPTASSEQAPWAKKAPAKEESKAEPSMLDNYIEHVKGGLTAASDFLGAIPGSIAAGVSVPYSAVKSLATGSDMADEVAKNAEASMKAFQPSEYIKLSPEAERGRQAAQEVFNKPAELGAQGLKGAAMLPYIAADKLGITEHGADFAQQMLHGDTPEMAPGFNALTETAGMVPGYGVFGLGGKGGTLEKTMGKDLEGPKDPSLTGTEPTIEDHGKYQVIKDSTGRVTKVVDKETGKVTDYTEPMSQGPLDVDAVIGGHPAEPPIGKEPLLNEPREPQIGETRSPEELAQEAQAQAEIDFKRSQNINYDAKTIGYDRLNKRRKATPNAPDLTLETPEEAQARVDEHKQTGRDISQDIDILKMETPQASGGRVARQRISELKEKLGQYGTYTGEILDRIQGDKPLENQIGKVKAQVDKINSLLEDRLIQLSDSTFVRNGEIARTKEVQAKYGKWTREITTEKDKLNEMGSKLYSDLNDKYGDFVNGPLPQTISKSQTYRGKQGGAIDLQAIKEGVQELGRRLKTGWDAMMERREPRMGEPLDEGGLEMLKRGYQAAKEPYEPQVYRPGDQAGYRMNKGPGGSQRGAVDPFSMFDKNLSTEDFIKRILQNKRLKTKSFLKYIQEVRPDIPVTWSDPQETLERLHDEIMLSHFSPSSITKEGMDAGFSIGKAKAREVLMDVIAEFLAEKDMKKPSPYGGPGKKQGGAVMNPWERKDPVYQETKQKLTEEQMAKEHEEFARLAQSRAPNNVQEQAQSQTPSTTLVGKFLDSAKTLVAIDDLNEKLSPVKQHYQNIVKSLLPLAAGPKETSGLIKTFANEYATALYARARLMQILNHLSKKELEQMYEARHSDLVSEKQGRQGKAIQALPEKLRKLHDVVQNDYIDALQGAQEGGVMVGGYENYTPARLIALLSDGTVKDIASITRKDSIGGVYGPKKSMGELKGRKYLTNEETEAAARDAFGDNVSVVRDIRALPMVTSDLRRVTATKALLEGIRKYGNDNFVETISTEPRRNWMTLNHPAFRNVWIHPDFHPAIESILNSTGNSWAITKALMTIKAKSMGLLMFNPFVHGSVIYFKAMPFDPLSVLSGLSYMRGAALRGSPLPGWMYDLYRVKDRASPEEGWAYQKDAMTHGFRPPQQAQGARMETSDLYADPKVGNSWTAQLVGKAARLFNKEIEAKQAVDTAGEFWHGSMLWNRITDLGMYVYDKSWRDMVKEGMKPEDAKVVGAHLANRYMGTVPFEAMSSGLRTALNLALFSRQFNVTNMGIYKDFVAGLPNEIQGQIKDIQGLAKGNRYLQTKQGKALVWDIVIGGAVVSSIIQSTVAAYRKDGEMFANLGKEGQGYANRFTDWIERMGHDPKAFFNPEITPMSKNEPGKEERIYLGNDNNNQGMYLKSPSGKLQEDLTSMWTQPIHTFLNKQSQLLKFFGGNDFKGGIIFGSKDIWGPDSKTLTIMQKIGTLGKIIVDSFLPFGNVDSVSELMKGNPNKINALKTAGALTPFSFSRGQPGGPQQAVLSSENAREDFRFMREKKEIDNMLDRHDIDGALKLLRKNKTVDESLGYIEQHLVGKQGNTKDLEKQYELHHRDVIKEHQEVNNY